MTATKRALLLTLVFLCLVCGFSVSQQPPTASVRGLVTQTGTNTPLPNATVELRAESGTTVIESITTGSDGAFLFPQVGAGKYRLSATRPGYVRTEYGQRQPSSPSLVITLAPGQRAADIQLFMVPGGVISGRVTEKGQPVGIADVFAIRVAYYDGQFFPTPVLSAKTNDLGEYRIFWLPPGRYYVATMINDQASNSPVYVNPDGDNGGLFSTRFPMRAVLNRAVGAGAAENEMHVPTFFPGTVTPDRAVAIDLRPGAEARNIDISAPALPVRRIRGNVTGTIVSVPAGQIAIAPPQVRLLPLNVATALGSLMGGVLTAQIEANGNFDLQRVFPGSYALAAASGPLSGIVPLEVREDDTNGVVINLTAGLSLAGRVTIERPAPITPDPAMRALRVMLVAEPAMPDILAFGSATPADGSFRIPDSPNTPGLPSGNYRVLVRPLLQPRSEPDRPPQTLPATLQNAYVKSIRLGDRDVLSDGLPIQSQIQESLEIVIGTNPGSIEGRVLNDQRQPAGAIWVALIPENKLRFRIDHKFTSTDAEGRFEISNVPPGDYKVFAWEDIPRLGWQEPDLVRPYEGRAVPVRIEEGKKTSVNVTALAPN